MDLTLTNNLPIDYQTLSIYVDNVVKESTDFRRNKVYSLKSVSGRSKRFCKILASKLITVQDLTPKMKALKKLVKDL